MSRRVRDRRRLTRDRDGVLYDEAQRRTVSPAELLDHVRDGGLFEVFASESGTDLTNQVLQELLLVQAKAAMGPTTSALGRSAAPLDLMMGLFGTASRFAEHGDESAGERRARRKRRTIAADLSELER